MEEREEKAIAKATLLVSVFSHSFHGMSFTLHPAGIPGEAPGKSSNESWAARQVERDYPGDASKQRVIITIMDGEWLSSFNPELR